jgi:hypothetical protein
MDGYESDMELTSSDPTPKVETPSEVTPETVVETPTVDPQPEEIKPVEPELYALPDGRKVDAAGLKREYENLLPEFTRKSQALAAIERERDINKPRDDTPEWQKPDYVPKDYAEVIEIAKKAAIQEMQSTYQAEQARVDAVKSEVESQVAELRSLDPKLDENALFTHANKYGFRDLKTAHANMMDIKRTAIETEQRVIKNLKTREADPIATVPGGNAEANDAYDPNRMSQYRGANEYLASLKGKQ